MIFTATEEQILQIAANAVNASTPMGMGFLHFQPKEYTPEEMRKCLSDYGLSIDYFDGRMTKFYIIRAENDQWRVVDHGPRSDYQSWASKYPTYEALAGSVLPQKESQ